MRYQLAHDMVPAQAGGNVMRMPNGVARIVVLGISDREGGWCADELVLEIQPWSEDDFEDEFPEPVRIPVRPLLDLLVEAGAL